MYLDLVDEISQTYGESELSIIFQERGYAYTPERWGMAAIRGIAEFKNEWRTPRGRVTLILKGDNFKEDLRARYVSADYVDAALATQMLPVQ